MKTIYVLNLIAAIVLLVVGLYYHDSKAMFAGFALSGAWGCALIESTENETH